MGQFMGRGDQGNNNHHQMISEPAESNLSSARIEHADVDGGLDINLQGDYEDANYPGRNRFKNTQTIHNYVI